MKRKTNKSLLKRLVVTKTKKVLKRHAGQNHFNTRNPGKITRNKRRDQSFSGAYNRTLKDALVNF